MPRGEGTWGCAASKGILFRTYSLAKGILFAIIQFCSSLGLVKGIILDNIGLGNSPDRESFFRESFFP